MLYILKQYFYKEIINKAEEMLMEKIDTKDQNKIAIRKFLKEISTTQEKRNKNPDDSQIKWEKKQIAWEHQQFAEKWGEL